MKHPHVIAVFNYFLALALAPLLTGVVNRVKARFAGRSGPPLFQAYYDIAKLLRKGAVYGAQTSWIFRASAPVILASGMIALLTVPFESRLEAVSTPAAGERWLQVRLADDRPAWVDGDPQP